MKQIVTHFTDNDAYTYSCQYYILQTYPRAEVRYSFFDRNHTKYPKGFGELLQEQINGMKDVVITEAEIVRAHPCPSPPLFQKCQCNFSLCRYS